uniref:Uncharacterized protein n=1 Tax=Rhizophagus irregularis (strain DAOM 181602 / DAOM 197198 / MUCL 43194) TaxID=747089 RepID=U9UEG9_RHIID
MAMDYGKEIFDTYFNQGVNILSIYSTFSSYVKIYIEWGSLFIWLIDYIYSGLFFLKRRLFSLILLPLVHLLWMFIITIAPGIVFGVLLSDESYYLYKISTGFSIPAYDILKLKDDMKLKEVILKLKDDVKPKEEYGLKLEEIAGLFEGVDSGRLKMFQILTRLDGF